MSDSLISIRYAHIDEAGHLSVLYRHFGDRDAGYFAECIDNGHAVLIASVNGEDAGFGIVNFASRYAPFKRLNIPEIQDLNVLPALRQQGVASALIEACEEEARRQGCSDIGLAVGLHKSYGPAQRLYVKMGYVPDGAGAVYDHKAPDGHLRYPLDDDFCLMLVKAL